MTVLPVSPLALSSSTSRMSPSRSRSISRRRRAVSSWSVKMVSRKRGLKMRSPLAKYSQTGPVTTKPLPSARPKTLTTAAITSATTRTS